MAYPKNMYNYSTQNDYGEFSIIVILLIAKFVEKINIEDKYRR